MSVGPEWFTRSMSGVAEELAQNRRLFDTSFCLPGNARSPPPGKIHLGLPLLSIILIFLR